MNDKIILLGNGQQVMARIVGQLGLHDDDDNVSWEMVTHVRSGGLIAIFSNYPDALDFATRAAAVFDFDAFATAIANSSTRSARKLFSQELKALLTLRDSYDTFLRFEMDSHCNMKPDELKRRVKS